MIGWLFQNLMICEKLSGTTFEALAWQNAAGSFCLRSCLNVCSVLLTTQRFNNLQKILLSAAPAAAASLQRGSVWRSRCSWMSARCLGSRAWPCASRSACWRFPSIGAFLGCVQRRSGRSSLSWNSSKPDCPCPRRRERCRLGRRSWWKRSQCCSRCGGRVASRRSRNGPCVVYQCAPRASLQCTCWGCGGSWLLCVYLNLAICGPNRLWTQGYRSAISVAVYWFSFDRNSSCGPFDYQVPFRSSEKTVHAIRWKPAWLKARK